MDICWRSVEVFSSLGFVGKEILMFCLKSGQTLISLWVGVTMAVFQTLLFFGFVVCIVVGDKPLTSIFASIEVLSFWNWF